MQTALPAVPIESELAAQGEQALQRLLAALESAGLPPPDATWLQALQTAFCCSPFIADCLCRHPEWLADFCTEHGLLESKVAQKLAPLAFLNEADFMASIRELRYHEMTRIGLCDLFGWQDLAQTLLALSDLADACLQAAHDFSLKQLTARYGMPQRKDGRLQSLVILAMGKLGGRELNYSSDIDLIFAFPEQGKTLPQAPSQRSIEQQQFFLQQAQLIIRLLHEITAAGFVFRIDTRLRPFGESGSLVVSYSFMETYYQQQGRDWERYAMIKARPVCGAPADQDELMRLLRPFVYRRYLDYSAFAALKDMKSRILHEVERRGLQQNIKLGVGGIREIEFIVQTFQLIRGGREVTFQQRELQQVLSCLAEQQCLPLATVSQLAIAYQFLRLTENRLQMMRDEQTHDIPTKPLELARLATALGLDNVASLQGYLEHYRQSVNRLFQQLLSVENTNVSEESITDFQLWLEGDITNISNLLKQQGFAESEALSSMLQNFAQSYGVKQMSQTARGRLLQLLPKLFKQISQQTKPTLTLLRLLPLLQAIVQRSVYIAFLLQYPPALERLIKLCSASAWIAQYITEQPILLDILLDPVILQHLPSRNQLIKQLTELLAAIPSADEEACLERLRHFKQEQLLRIAALDVTGQLTVMQVSDQLTWLAEVILQAVKQRAEQLLLPTLGRPQYLIDGKPMQAELAIIAYGKLGGIELAYNSDLDLVFLHTSEGQQQQTTGPRVVSNTQYFVRLGQKIVHILTTPTMGGILYETDMRLRPDGSAGLLSCSFDSFARYQRERAWIWEQQALVRARCVVASEDFQTRFSELRRALLAQPREQQKLQLTVKEMRERMRKELGQAATNKFDLKQDIGGIADIEFIVQYAVLAWSAEHIELTRYTDNMRILETLAQLHLLPADTVKALMAAYLHLRNRVHQLALQSEPAIVSDIAASAEHIAAVTAIWQGLMINGS